MEFTAESSLIKAQNLLVQFLSQKNYYKDNNNINYKLYNAQLLVNEYVSNQHKLMFDNSKYMQEKKIMENVSTMKKMLINLKNIKMILKKIIINQITTLTSLQ